MDGRWEDMDVLRGRKLVSLHPRVIVADPDPLARRAMRDVLDGADVIVIAEAATAQEALELAAHYLPDVLLLELSLTGPAVERFTVRHPLVRIVALATHYDEQRALDALRAGACGVVSKATAIDALGRIVVAAVAGEAPIPRPLVSRLVSELRRMPPGGAGLRPVRSRLTAREWEVLDLLCDGRTTTDIADVLVVSIETVRSHVKCVLRKLDVSSRGEAIARARELRASGALAV